MALTVAALIPTIGRVEELVDVLMDLAVQTRIPDEVIVIDQNRPALVAALKPAADALRGRGIRFRHLSSSVPGLPDNSNRGLKSTSCDVLIYLDDDVRLEPGLIEAHLRVFESSPDVGAVAGRVEQATGDIAPEDIRSTGVYRRWSGRVIAHFNSLKRQEVDLAQGCHMSFRREALLKISGFDEGYDGNHYFGESDTCLRLKTAGYRIVFEPEASLKHLQAARGGCRTPDRARFQYYWVKNGLRLYRRHSPALGLPLFVAKVGWVSLLKAVYRFDVRIAWSGWRAIGDGLGQDDRVRSAGLSDSAATEVSSQ